MQETLINWTQYTWGPFSGCEEIASECKFCYAKGIAEQKRGTIAFPSGFELTLRPHKFAEPGRLLRAKGPQLIFCNSMSDPGITGEGRIRNVRPGALTEIPDDYLAQFWRTMHEVSAHRYQVLTKRPGAVVAFLRRMKIRIPESVWMGITIGHESSLDKLRYVEEFRDLGARVVFISAEPILGSLEKMSLRGVDWLITGGESGNHFAQIDTLRRDAQAIGGRAGAEKMAEASRLARRFLVERKKGVVSVKPEGERWVRELRDKARDSGTAFWHKQWGGTTPHMGGRMLDGETHDGLPVHVPGAMPAGYVHKLGGGAGTVAPPMAVSGVPQPRKGQLHLLGGAS